MPKRVAKEKPFATEVDLCAEFIAALGKEKDRWTAYAETCGWDILLVRSADGFQIGIQAKLKLNSHVISQMLEDGRPWTATKPGPDCRAVLVPNESAGAFDLIAGYIGFTIIRVSKRLPHETGDCFKRVFRPRLPIFGGESWGADDWYECAPAKRHPLPEYVPDVRAGASAPLQLTKWKIAALKIAVTLEIRGYLTRADFKHIGIDYRRWIAVEYGWLQVQDGRYIVGPHWPDFKRQHPRVFEEIKADHEKWMLPQIELWKDNAKQEGLRL